MTDTTHLNFWPFKKSVHVPVLVVTCREVTTLSLAKQDDKQANKSMLRMVFHAISGVRTLTTAHDQRLASLLS